uniref:Uncharacterized protein n=1 Tax=Anopheles farauti TaxID=69004 RepID=A0A182Q8U2_9DIPT
MELEPDSRYSFDSSLESFVVSGSERHLNVIVGRVKCRGREDVSEDSRAILPHDMIVQDDLFVQLARHLGTARVRAVVGGERIRIDVLAVVHVAEDDATVRIAPDLIVARVVLPVAFRFGVVVEQIGRRWVEHFRAGKDRLPVERILQVVVNTPQCLLVVDIAGDFGRFPPVPHVNDGL